MPHCTGGSVLDRMAVPWRPRPHIECDPSEPQPAYLNLLFLKVLGVPTTLPAAGRSLARAWTRDR